MSPPRRRVVVSGILSAAIAWSDPRPVAAAAQTELTQDDLRAATKEALDAEVELERLRREVPDCSGSETGFQQYLRERASAEKLVIEFLPVAANDRLPLEGGAPSPVELQRFDVTARAAYEKVHGLLRSVARVGTRLVDLEDVEITAASGDTVNVRARVLMACWRPAPEPSLPSPLARGPGAQIAIVRAKALRHRSTARALSALRTRLEPRAFVDALANFDHDARALALALTRIRFTGGEAALEGVVLGAAARAGLRSALQNAGFDGNNLRLAPAGGCQPFSATGRLKAVERTTEVVIFNGVFDERAASACGPRPGAPARVGARAASASTGPVTMRLRDVDVPDAFRVLHDATSLDFTVDADVKGRLSVDIVGATAEQALAEMSSAGVVIGPGPLHRVKRTGARPAAPAPDRYTGDAMSFALRDAALSDVLCLFQQVTGLKILMPPSLDARVNLFTDGTPWDHLLESALGQAGLEYAIDGELFVGAAAQVAPAGRRGLVPACEAGTASHRRDWTPKLEALGTDDLVLSGLARAGEGWKAYALAPGPSRRLLTLVPGQELFGAQVSAVGASGVTVQGADRRTRTLPFTP